MDTRAVRIAIAVAVTIIWGASYTLSIINHNYHPPPEINAVMLLVAGFFFASGIREQAHAVADHEQEEIRHMIEDELRRHEEERDRGVEDAE